ncbi:MAG: helix-turn-helix transcriptional regulator [Oscillospiraceae bacterium]|nr:helix-turn-helix transcriptional regulator [Oscillospiraceae bacterium]
MQHIEAYHGITEEAGTVHSQMHSHPFYEIYCFLDGNAEYCVEGRRYQLSKGDLMLMRCGEVHHYELSNCSRYERMGVHFDLPEDDTLFDRAHLLAAFDDRAAGKLNHYPAAAFEGSLWEFYLRKITQAKDKRQALCYLLPRLMELADDFLRLQELPSAAERDPAAPIMKYISQNLQQKLSLEQLCAQFYISKTHLNRLMRQSTGTTVWEYITVKRLFLAREKIMAGERPTEVYAACGFSDYTTFYRAYKQHFGVSPSGREKNG